MILIDQDKITVESYVGIKYISEELIVISCTKFELSIEGIALMVSGLNKYEIIIKGKIGGIRFDESNA